MVSQRRWLGYGTRLRAGYYATIRNVLRPATPCTCWTATPAADGAELALLRRAEATAMLLAPVIAAAAAWAS